MIMDYKKRLDPFLEYNLNVHAVRIFKYLIFAIPSNILKNVINFCFIYTFHIVVSIFFFNKQNMYLYT